MGKVELPNNSGIVNIIAGKYQNIVGPAFTFTPINVFDIRLNTNANVSFDLPVNYNTYNNNTYYLTFNGATFPDLQTMFPHYEINLSDKNIRIVRR